MTVASWSPWSRSQGGVAITIDDDGPGISEALREQIFEPFFTTKVRGEGTGLGLPVCRKLVEEHGGSLSVGQSAAGGARFRVELPVVPAEKCFDKNPAESLV